MITEPLGLLALALLIVIALLLGWLGGAARARRAAALAQEQAISQAVTQAVAQARRETQMQVQATANTQIAAAQERAARVPQLEAQLQAQAVQTQAAREQAAELHSQLAAQAMQLNAERRAAAEKLQLLTDAREALTHQFKSLASDILEEKSRRFTEQNQVNMGQLLDPLKTRLQEFQGKVEQFYDAEGKQRSALAQQVHQLMGLNQTLSAEAHNLTQALRGSTKAQGNWGELILERVLETAGLRRGIEYDVQENHQREDGSRAQPDVVIHLPEDRHLVIDAKVSLIAYEEYANAGDDTLRAVAQRRHMDSVRAHIKGLAERNYQQLYALKSLDFVLMFVPIEPAFMLAVTSDSQLYSDAWNKNVLLVSPSTLLFVVRTVAHLWRQEAQSRNAQEIARRGAELYDRLSGFVADLERVGKNLALAQDAYGEAFNKLSKNRGNVIRQAEMLKELGIKPSKSLPPALTETAREDAAGE